MRSARGILVLLAGLLALAAPAARAAAPIDADCLVCHGDDPTLSMKRGGRTVSLHVRRDELAASVHAKVSCVSCHVGFDPYELPHRKDITPVDCTRCHRNAPARHVIHGAIVAERVQQGAAGAACKSCHGTHGVRTVATRASGATVEQLDATCRRCHPTEVEHFERSAHGRALAAHEPGAPNCVACHQKPITPADNGGQVTAALKLEQEKLCLSCHLDDPEVRERMGPGAGFIAAYEQSVHGRALQGGNAKAANCVDCHGSHDMAKGFEPGSKSNKQHIAATCGQCHTQIAHTYEQSVHGQAVAAGNLDAPTCTNCHGEHTIRKANAPNSPVAPANVSAEVCSPCHSSVRMSAKYGLQSDRFRTFSDSFHGLAVRAGSVSAANCASCHGTHDILPSSDPRSTVNPKNLAHTCGQCHPGATAAFASGKVHVEATEKDEPLLYWISFIYILLITGTIGGMFLHNVLDFWRKSRHQLAVRRGEIPAPAHHGRGLYLRMTLSERLQHGTLLVSFVVLVLTGFALRYPELWVFEGIRRFSNDLFEARGVAHRVAGVVMILASLFHVYYLSMTARGREFLRDIMLRPQDLKDVLAAGRFYLGLSQERPRFGRFSYIEKSEYWALVWGTVVMAGTGIIMWFQDPFIALISKLGWDAARTIHVYEAVLATLAILVWHMYFVIFNPDVYPMNLAWLKGTVSEGEMEEEHPLELEELRRREARAEDEAGARAQAGPGDAATGSTPPGGSK